MVWITLSKSQGIWQFKFISKIHSANEIKKTTYYYPIKFIGGNNKIINIKHSSPQTKDISINEDNREYMMIKKSFKKLHKK